MSQNRWATHSKFEESVVHRSRSSSSSLQEANLLSWQESSPNGQPSRSGGILSFRCYVTCILHLLLKLLSPLTVQTTMIKSSPIREFRPPKWAELVGQSKARDVSFHAHLYENQEGLFFYIQRLCSMGFATPKGTLISVAFDFSAVLITSIRWSVIAQYPSKWVAVMQMMVGRNHLQPSLNSCTSSSRMRWISCAFMN